MSTTSPTLDHPAPSIRELIVELARTEDELRESRCRGLTERDRGLVRHQAAVVRALHRRHAQHD